MVRRTNRKVGIFAAIAALLLCLSFANVVVAIENLEGTPESIRGTVIAIDTSLPMNILTLQSSEPGLSSPNKEITLFVDEQTVVTVCDTKTSLNDIRPGQEVQVSYFKLADLAFANSVYKGC
ncbi:MAG TPA: hypothetical protein VFK23_02500 [Nitrospirota bacterium]|nr:hypothetical protein [Nitrospirota bacterium]